MNELLPTETVAKALGDAYAYPEAIAEDGIEGGLTKRELLAAMAMQGLVSYSGSFGVSAGPGDIAGRSVQLADALLQELSK